MKFLLTLMAVAAAGVGLVCVGDWIYAKTVEYRYRAWERTIKRDADGVRVDCREFSVGEGDTAILLIHGYGDSPALYRKLAPALAERGYACRATRLPGFAEPMAAYRTTTRQQWLATVHAEVEALREQHDQVWLLGHSTGAALAIQESLITSNLVDGLVLVAPLLEVSSRRSPVLKTRQWFSFGQHVLRRTRMLETAFPVNAHDPEAQAYPYRDKFVPIEVTENLYALLDEVHGRAPDVSVPVFMALAENDKVVDNGASRSFYHELGSPRRQLLEQPLAGHMLPVDTGWTHLLEEVDAFIRGHGDVSS